MSASAHQGVLPAWVGELSEVRERLARLETRAESHDEASEERHGQVVSALKELEERLVEADKRSWRLTVGLSALAMGGGAGAMEILRSALGA